VDRTHLPYPIADGQTGPLELIYYSFVTLLYS
jgi:hypothetical protein